MTGTWTFYAKFLHFLFYVSGAGENSYIFVFMYQERERAATIGYEDPINPTYEATTTMYHKVLRKVMRTIQVREKGRVAVMVASHNEDTVRYTVEQ